MTQIYTFLFFYFPNECYKNDDVRSLPSQTIQWYCVYLLIFIFKIVTVILCFQISSLSNLSFPQILKIKFFKFILLKLIRAFYLCFSLFPCKKVFFFPIKIEYRKIIFLHYLLNVKQLISIQLSASVSCNRNCRFCVGCWCCFNLPDGYLFENQFWCDCVSFESMLLHMA